MEPLGNAAAPTTAALRARWIPLIWGLLWLFQTAGLVGLHFPWQRTGAGLAGVWLVILVQSLLCIPLVAYAVINRKVAPANWLRIREVIVLGMLFAWLMWDVLLFVAS
jgi:hypothetical protein